MATGTGKKKQEKRKGLAARTRTPRHKLPQLFKPGQSGNPAGRTPGTVSKHLKSIRELLSHLDEDNVQVLHKIINDAKNFTDRPWVILDAIRLCWEYAHGKPKQPIVAGNGEGQPFDFYMFLQKVYNVEDGNATEPKARTHDPGAVDMVRGKDGYTVAPQGERKAIGTGKGKKKSK